MDKNILHAVMMQESGGNRNAVSPKNARGLFQIMPATARNPGFGVKPLQNNSDEEQWRFANDYLDVLYNRYNGDLPKALAAYNAGAGAVDKYGGVPPYHETKNYVKNILANLNPINTANAAEDDWVTVTPEMLQAQQDVQSSEQAGQPQQSENDWVTVSTPQQQQPLDQWVDAPDEYQGRKVADMSAPSQFLIGTGNSTMDLGRGALQHLNIGDQDKLQQNIIQSKALREELGKTKAGKAGNFFGDVAAPMMVPGSGLANTIGQSAVFGALQPTVGDNEYGQVAKNAAIAAAIPTALGAIGKAAKGFTPSADAKKFMDMGIQPTVGQSLRPGLIGDQARKLEEASTGTPFLGAISDWAERRGLTEWKHSVFEAPAIPGKVSANGKLGQEGVAELRKGFNRTYNKVLSGHDVPIKPEFIDKIYAVVEDSSRYLDDIKDRQWTDNFLAGEFKKIQIGEGNTVSAKDLHKIESVISAKAREIYVKNPELSRLLSDVEDQITKYRTANLPAGVGKEVKMIDRQYAKFKRIQKAAVMAAGTKGDFSPAQLDRAALGLEKSITRKSEGNALMQDMAESGKTVFGQRLSESGTAPRTFFGKLVTPTGAAGGVGEAATAAMIGLPQAAALFGGAWAGGTRGAQKAMMGGYPIQPRLSDFVTKFANRSKIPMAYLSLQGANQ